MARLEGAINRALARGELANRVVKLIEVGPTSSDRVGGSITAGLTGRGDVRKRSGVDAVKAVRHQPGGEEK